MIRKILIAIMAVFGAILFDASNIYALSWTYDFSLALNQAKTSNKPIMADFYTDWCGWCKKLDSDTYSNADVQRLAGKFISVKIDGDKNPGLVARYGVSGYPTVIFFGPDGTILERFIGYKGPSDFVRAMTIILEKTQKAASADESGSFMVASGATADGKKKIQVPKVGSEFVYNGYIEVGGQELTAQINYGGVTHFVKAGDTLKEYKVLSVSKFNVVLEGEDGLLVMEFKKPVGKVRVLSNRDDAADGDGQANTHLDKKAVVVRGWTPDVTASLTVIGIAAFIIIIIYVYLSLCLYLIAKKAGVKNAWLGWVPVANVFLMCAISKISYWWLLALFVPFLNILVMLYIWYKITMSLGKPGWLAILLIVPVVHYIVMGYLAFSKTAAASTAVGDS